MTRADRSLIRQCILDAAEHCVAEKRTVLTRDVRNALRARGQDPTLPEMRRVRLLEMADAMDMFCQGTDGEMFDRDGTPWPGRHHAGRSGDLCPRGLQRAALHRLHQPDQHGEQHRRARPVPGPADRQRDRRRSHHHQEPAARALCRENYKNVAQVGRLVLAGDAKHRRSAARRRAHAQHDRVVGVPVDAAGRSGEDRQVPRTLAGAEGADALRTQGSGQVHRGRHPLQEHGSAVPRRAAKSLPRARANRAEEKAERYQLMQQHGVSELDAAFKVAEKIDRARGIESPTLDLP